MLLELDAAQGRGPDPAADRQSGRQRADPRTAQGLCGEPKGCSFRLRKRFVAVCSGANARRARPAAPRSSSRRCFRSRNSTRCSPATRRSKASLPTPADARGLRQALARIRRARAGGRDAIKAYRGVAAEIAGLEALIADPATDPEMRAMAAAEKPALEASARRARTGDQARAAAQRCDGRAQRHPRNPRRHRRRRGGAVRRRPVPHVRALCRQAGLEGRGDLGQRRHDGRLQGDHRGNPRPRRLRQAQIRIRRASRAARARYRGLRPHPYLDRHRRGAAGGRGSRHRHQRCRPQDRHLALRRRRRPARQQDRIRPCA